MIIIPLSHEKGEVQRLPYVTLGIIILNVILFMITLYAEPKARENLIRAEKQLTEYYLNNLYLTLSEKTFQKLRPQTQMRINMQKDIQSAVRQREDDNVETEMSEAEWERQQEMEERRREFYQEMGIELPEETEAVLDDAEIEQRQETLNTYAREFEDAIENLFYRKYGYIPARGGFLTLFSSMFLHGGFMHILFNMFFLYLSGCNIEDLWGRLLFPIFYLIGGIAASLCHALIFPESNSPCIGASGAIAAVMGAFMIRLYKTKIYFFYTYFFFTKLRHGTFSAPAYLMLPLWLLQQLIGALKSEGIGSGVAFWAHIGGFLFGAMVALLFKLTGFEEEVIAPAIERKTNLVDENFSSGMKKIQENDLEGAVADLTKAVEYDPENSIAHSELSKLYCRLGKKKEARISLKRAVNLYMKQGLTEAATDDYLEISTAFPDIALEPFHQTRIIEALEAREMYKEAAAACKNLFRYCQSDAETKDGPEAVSAMIRYGDTCQHYLKRPKRAFNAYKTLLESCKYLTSDQKKLLKTKAQEAATAAKQQAREAVELKKQQAQEKKKKQVQKTASESRKRKKPAIPLKKKIRLVRESKAPGKYQVGSAAPYQANKVMSAEDGLNLNRPGESPLLFDNIYLICVFEFAQVSSIIYADLFVRGNSRPYRIPSNKVIFSEFLTKPDSSSFENFRQHILYIISQTDSVYLDQGTMTFLKTGKTRLFPNQGEVETWEKSLWKQLIGEVRFQCEKCWEVYWISGKKLPEKGARIKCKKCGHLINVTR